MKKKRFVCLLICLFVAVVLPLLNLQNNLVYAAPSWLTGWQYRKSHVINSASGAGTGYQLRIKAVYGELNEKEQIIPLSEIVSTLPVPSGTTIISAQAATYWDGAYLHVWYGATTGDANNDDIYYTKSSAPFTSWNIPTKVIDRTDGIRDPTSFIEGDYIYFFSQSYDGSKVRPIRLYKILKTADFTNSTNYTYVGVVVDLGVSGSYDQQMVASPTIAKINATYYLAYEALSRTGVYSIGRAKTTSIESLPWTKDGQMRDTAGNIIYNPTGNTRAIVPDTFPDSDTLVIHYDDSGTHWDIRYINGDIPNNSMTLSSGDINPQDGYGSHANFAHVGLIGGFYYFSLQSWDGTAYLRLYAQPKDLVALNSHARTDFGDVRFTDDDGSTLLDHWMEEKVDSNYAIFWVEVTDDLSSQNQTIYIYYGKSDATTTSNGDNVFLFFDDFPGSSWDTNKWQQVGSPTISVASSTVTISRSSYSGSWSFHGLRSKTFQVDEGRLLAKLQKTLSYGDNIIGTVDINYWSKGRKNAWSDDKPSSPYIQHYITSDGRDVGYDVSGTVLQTMSLNTWYRIMLTRWGTSYLKGWVNGVYKGQVTSNVQDASTYTAIGIEEWGTHTNENIVIDSIAIAKYVDPEPSHGSWGSEETKEYVIIDQKFVSDERADVGSVQTIGFHAKWNNGSNVVGGSIYVNGTNYVTNSTGWINFNVESSIVRKEKWVVTGVNCGGVTLYIQTAQTPSIVWDRIKIIDGGLSKGSLTLGEKATIWFKALYEYDNDVFDGANGVPYLNGLAMTWSTTNNRWEYNYTATTVGTKAFTISGFFDSSYNLTLINDIIGAQTIHVWSSPFSVISNSTISELSFNSTNRVLSFTVSGPSGTIGSTNVTIAKTLIEDINELKVYLDGNQISYTAISTDYSWLIHFTYQHSTHKVAIILASTNTESTVKTTPEVATTFGGIIMAILAAALLIIKTRQRYHIKNKQSDKKKNLSKKLRALK